LNVVDRPRRDAAFQFGIAFAAGFQFSVKYKEERLTGPTRGIFSPIFFLALASAQSAERFFSGSREAKTPRTIFFIGAGGRNATCIFFIGAGEHNTTCGVFFFETSAEVPPHYLRSFLGNSSAQPGGGRRPQIGLPYW
jgi:hypothetical protein